MYSVNEVLNTMIDIQNKTTPVLDGCYDCSITNQQVKDYITTMKKLLKELDTETQD